MAKHVILENVEKWVLFKPSLLPLWRKEFWTVPYLSQTETVHRLTVETANKTIPQIMNSFTLITLHALSSMLIAFPLCLLSLPILHGIMGTGTFFSILAHKSALIQCLPQVVGYILSVFMNINLIR